MPRLRHGPSFELTRPEAPGEPGLIAGCNGGFQGYNPPFVIILSYSTATNNHVLTLMDWPIASVPTTERYSIQTSIGYSTFSGTNDRARTPIYDAASGKIAYSTGRDSYCADPDGCNQISYFDEVAAANQKSLVQDETGRLFHTMNPSGTSPSTASRNTMVTYAARELHAPPYNATDGWTVGYSNGGRKEAGVWSQGHIVWRSYNASHQILVSVVPDEWGDDTNDYGIDTTVTNTYPNALAADIPNDRIWSGSMQENGGSGGIHQWTLDLGGPNQGLAINSILTGQDIGQIEYITDGDWLYYTRYYVAQGDELRRIHPDGTGEQLIWTSTLDLNVVGMKIVDGISSPI